MERKTHRESWKGEESVKDRFTVAEDKMVPFLTGEYTVEQARRDISAKVCTLAAACAMRCPWAGRGSCAVEQATHQLTSNVYAWSPLMLPVLCP